MFCILDSSLIIITAVDGDIEMADTISAPADTTTSDVKQDTGEHTSRIRASSLVVRSVRKHQTGASAAASIPIVRKLYTK